MPPYKDKAAAAAANKRWRKKNPNKVRENMRRWKTENPERLRTINRRRRGLPVPPYPAPTHCECCRRPFTKTPALDHDHETGQFRGWLCGKCNVAIGMLGDTLQGVENASRYLNAVALLYGRN
jgi:hypothetical protein